MKFPQLPESWRTTTKWTAIVSAVIIAIQAFGALFNFTIDDATVAKVMTAVNSLLTLFVILGVLTNDAEK